MSSRSTLRQLVTRKNGLVVPGAYDGVSARLVERTGFPAVYMTGYGTSASRLGLPDLGRGLLDLGGALQDGGLEGLLELEALQLVFGVRKDALGDGAGDLAEDSEDGSDHGFLLRSRPD